MADPQPPPPPGADPLDLFLSRSDLTPEVALEALKLRELRRSTPVEVQLERAKARTQNARSWYSLVPWAALFTLIGSIVTAYMTGYFGVAKNKDIHDYNLLTKDMDYQYNAFEKLITINDAHLIASGKTDEERVARVCLAALFGLVEFPEYVIGVPRTDLENYSKAFKALLDKKYKCESGEVGLPETFPAPINPEGNPQACPANIDYAALRLPVPTALEGSSKIGDKLLLAALRELNEGIH